MAPMRRLSRAAATLAAVAALSGESPAQPPAPPQNSAAPALPTPPAAASSFTLDALTDIAQANNPRLAAAAAAVEAARGQAYQAGLCPDPTVQLGVQQLGGNQGQYFFTLSQQIVTAGKLRLSSEAGMRGVRQAELAFMRTRFDLLSDVRTAFFAALANRRRVEVQRELTEIARRSLDVIQKSEKGGQTARGDVLQIDIEFQKADVGLRNAETAYETTLRTLAATVGAPRLVVGSVEGDLFHALPGFDYGSMRDGPLQQHADLLSALIEKDKSRILLRRAEVDPIPDITPSIGYQYQVLPTHNQIPIQVQLQVPLWNRNRGNIRTARANVTAAAAAYDKLENDLTSKLADAVGRYTAAAQKVERYEKQLMPKAQEAMRLYKAGRDAGEFDFLRLLQSQRTVVEINQGFVDAHAERWDAAVDVASLIQLERFP